jgi:hypothetical protein
MPALLAVMMAECGMSSVLAMMAVVSAVMAELVAMSAVMGVIAVVLSVIAVVSALYGALPAISAVMAAVLVVIAAVLPGMAVARGIASRHKSLNADRFLFKTPPIRDRMARLFALAHARASISHANARPEPLPCVGEFPERTSGSLRLVSIKVDWHSIVCASR